MKPLFYYFGVSRGERMFHIKAPIYFSQSGISVLHDSDLQELLKKKGIDVFNLVEEFTNARYELIGFGKTKSGVVELLKHGKLLTQSIMAKDWNIFFVDEDKIVLFKSHRETNPFQKTKGKMWDVLSKLSVLDKKVFLNEMKEMRKSSCKDCCDNDEWWIKAKEADIMLAYSDKLMIGIKPKNYAALKEHVKKNFKPLAPYEKKAKTPRTR